MNKIINYKLVIFIILITFLMVVELDAQCPMCRMAAETNLKDGGTEGKGLNKGILYMLSMPYLLVATIGLLWWRNNRDISTEENE